MASDAEAAAAATELGKTPLAELVSDEVGAADSWNLKVFRSYISEYTYQYQGKEGSSKKLVAVLVSSTPTEYCLGVARVQKRNDPELLALHKKFAPGTLWRFSRVRLNKTEKPQYINTSCRIAIDLRASQATALLQSSLFPSLPEPATTIADILLLKNQQRFDLMAVPTEVLSHRRTGAAQVVADVRLVDGSADPRSQSAGQVLATIPLTLFFKNDAEFAAFQNYIGKTPLLFVCLNGNAKGGEMQVTTLKEHSYWQEAAGQRRDEMAANTPFGNNVADVAVLPTFVATEATDYLSGTATLTACSVLDIRAASHELLEDDATEHVYQLNHVYVPAPAATQDVMHEGRLFAIFDCWDFSMKLQIAFRAKAMASLAAVDADSYTTALSTGELRHPLLSSLRVRVKKSTGDRDLTAIVVEAESLNLEAHDIPNDSVDALHGLLAAGGPPAAERLIAAHLPEITNSPFYNMAVAGEPAEKSLVLLLFTQRSIGSQQQGSFRLVADNVLDAGGGEATVKFGTIARCPVERCPDFSAQKGTIALAVICKAARPAKQHHAADLYIEAMEIVPPAKADQAKTLVAKLRTVAAAAASQAEPSQESPYQQRKCRKLTKYPTMS